MDTAHRRAAGRRGHAADHPTPGGVGLARLLRPLAGRLAVALVLSVLGAACAVVQPLTLQRLVDSFTASAPVQVWILLLVGVTVAEAVCAGLQYYALTSTAERFTCSLRRSLAARLLRLPIPAYDAVARGDLISRLGADSTQVRNVLTTGLFSIVSSALLVVGALVMMTVVDPVLTVVAVGATLLVVVVTVPIGGAVRTSSGRYQDAVGRLTATMDRSLASVRLIRSLNATEHQEEQIDEAADAAYGHGLRVARLQAWIEPMISLAGQGALLVVLAVGGARVAAGTLSVGDLVAFILYLFMVVVPLGQALAAYTTVQTGLAAFGRIRDVLGRPVERTTGTPVPRTAVAGEPLLVLDGVRVDRGTTPGALRGLTATIRAGSRTAVVGPSGAGKSSFLDLVDGFVEPSRGVAVLDGRALPSVDPRALRRRVFYLEQGAPPLAGTLRDNLVVAAPGAGERRLRSALERAGLGDVAARHPLGLDAPVGDSGLGLSGGQRQRLAWARLLLSDADVVLLDEPTASVDAVSEAEFAALVDALPPATTVITVAHRLTTVVDADQILVLQAGRVIDSGCHDDLLDRCAVYRRMARQQLLV